jgi:hypothetical protein
VFSFVSQIILGSFAFQTWKISFPRNTFFVEKKIFLRLREKRAKVSQRLKDSFCVPLKLELAAKKMDPY